MSGMSNQNTFLRVCLLKRQIKGCVLWLLLISVNWLTHIVRSAVVLLTIRQIDSQRAPATLCLPFYLSSISIFSFSTGSLIEVRHLSHLELRARQAAVKLPQASSKRTGSAVTESALVALQCHFLREGNHYKKPPARTKVKQSRAIQNLKNAVSRWGASFSAEVNAAGFVKTTAVLPQSQEGQLKWR